MDISELPHYIVFVLALVAFFAVFIIAGRLSRRWLRWPVRGSASAGMVLTLLMLAIDYSCTQRLPRVYSPDGRHVAVLSWWDSAGPGLSSVKVRHRYSPFAKSVFSGTGFWNTDPHVRWIDNNHLLIQYDDYDDWPHEGEQVCSPQALGVEIICQHPSHYLDPKSAVVCGDEYYSELKQRRADYALVMYTDGFVEKHGDEWRRVLADLDRESGGVTDFKAVGWEAAPVGPLHDSTNLECVRAKYRVTRNTLVSQETLLVCPLQRDTEDMGIAAHEITRTDTGQHYETGLTIRDKTIFPTK